MQLNDPKFRELRSRRPPPGPLRHVIGNPGVSTVKSVPGDHRRLHCGVITPSERTGTMAAFPATTAGLHCGPDGDAPWPPPSYRVPGDHRRLHCGKSDPTPQVFTFSAFPATTAGSLRLRWYGRQPRSTGQRSRRPPPAPLRHPDERAQGSQRRGVPGDHRRVHCGAVADAGQDAEAGAFPATTAGLHCGAVADAGQDAEAGAFPATTAGLHCGAVADAGQDAEAGAFPATTAGFIAARAAVAPSLLPWSVLGGAIAVAITAATAPPMTPNGSSNGATDAPADTACPEQPQPKRLVPGAGQVGRAPGTATAHAAAALTRPPWRRRLPVRPRSCRRRRSGTCGRRGGSSARGRGWPGPRADPARRPHPVRRPDQRHDPL